MTTAEAERRLEAARFTTVQALTAVVLRLKIAKDGERTAYLKMKRYLEEILREIQGDLL